MEAYREQCGQACWRRASTAPRTKTEHRRGQEQLRWADTRARETPDERRARTVHKGRGRDPAAPGPAHSGYRPPLPAAASHAPA